MSLPRFPDWTASSEGVRQTLRASARQRARALDTRLNAFVTIDRGSPRTGGALDGLPYAAKDMFNAAGHAPTCGLATPGELDIRGESAVLARLGAAGADRVGFTNMTALAYEPSGFNAARGRVRNPGIRISSPAAPRPARRRRWRADRWSRQWDPIPAARCEFPPMPAASVPGSPRGGWFRSRARWRSPPRSTRSGCSRAASRCFGGGGPPR